MIAAGIGEGVVLGLAVWLALRRADPTRAAFLLIGTVLLFAPNGYSWYFTWIVPLLVFLSEPGVAAAHDPAVSFVQNFHQLPRAGRVALRSVVPVDVLCAVLCAAGMGVLSKEGGFSWNSRLG